MKKPLPWVLAVLSGVLGFLGYIGYDLFFLDWFFLVPLFWAARTAAPKRAFFLGWLAGAVGHAGGFYWLVHMLTVFAGANLAVGIVGLAAFAAYNGLVFAVCLWAVRRLEIQRGWAIWWTAPVVWTALENVFPAIFPNYIGASQYPLLPITQIADITGILGISFLLIWCNATIYVVAEGLVVKKTFPVKATAAFGGAILFVSVYGWARISQVDSQAASAPKIRTAIVQAGKGEAFKFRNPRRFVRLHQEMSKRADAKNDVDVIIWPEAIVIEPLPRDAKRLPRLLSDYMVKPLMFGALTSEGAGAERKMYTSALLAGADGDRVGLYDKRILMPFGEYLPLGEMFPILYEWLPYTSRFQSGESFALMSFGDHLLSVNICYEDLFFNFVRQGMLAEAGQGKPLPHAIVNLTNDSWYGDTTEPMEHLVLASFRAIEHRRALVRATNTGISAIVDPVGRLNQRTGQWTREVLVGEVPMLSGRTVFSYFGNWFGWTVSILALLGLGLSFRTALGALP